MSDEPMEEEDSYVPQRWQWKPLMVRSLWILNQRGIDRWDHDGFTPQRVYLEHLDYGESFPHW